MASKKDKGKSTKTAHVLNLITTPAQRQAAAQKQAEEAGLEGSEAVQAPRTLTPPVVEVAHSHDEQIADQIRSALSDELALLAEEETELAPAAAPAPAAEKAAPVLPSSPVMGATSQAVERVAEGLAASIAPAEGVPEAAAQPAAPEPAAEEVSAPAAVAEALAAEAQASMPEVAETPEAVQAPAPEAAAAPVPEAAVQASAPEAAPAAAPSAAVVEMATLAEEEPMEELAPAAAALTQALAVEAAAEEASIPATRPLIRALAEEVSAATASKAPAPTASSPAEEAGEPVEEGPEELPVLEGPPASPAPVYTSPAADHASKGSDLYYANIMQTLVESMAPRYIKMFGVCSCARCAADVKALTLTNLTPHYAVFHRRERIPMTTLYENRYGSTIATQLTKACTIVRLNPHHR